MNNAPTPYIEANVLLAVQGGEPDVAKEKLRGMLHAELYDLHLASRDLASMCASELERRVRAGEGRRR